MKFFLKIRVTANHPVEGFVFPKVTGLVPSSLVDFVRGKGFDGL